MPRKANPLTPTAEQRLGWYRDRLAELEDEAANVRRLRDLAIVKARRRDVSLRAIADAAGVSHQHVANIAAEADQ